MNIPASTGAITGTVFNDASADGTRGGSESGLARVQVYLDTNRSYRKREPAQVVVGFKVRRIGG